MIPDRCSVAEKGHRCANPPSFIVSITTNTDAYMIGVTCDRHKAVVSDKISKLQNRRSIPQGKIRFERLKAVGTDCINASPDDLISI